MTLNYVRQGITLGGVDVVIVAATPELVDEVRDLTTAAVNEHGVRILQQSNFPLDHGDRVLTQPVIDLATRTMLGYVELAP